MRKTKKISAYTGMSIVVANMIGTGAFTSLGFQLEGITNTAVILALWVLGGLLALSGAFSYAEVGTVIKKSGGEFSFLSRIYHPVVGYLSGWISLTVGFAAPIALAAIAFTAYIPVPFHYPKIVAIVLIAFVTLAHSFSLKSSSVFQNIATLFKVLLIIVIILIGLLTPAGRENAVNFQVPYFNELFSTFFAVSLIYVSYSYSGWNAAAYITEEFRNPRRSLPFALIGGALVVTILYTLLQYVFLRHVPLSELAGTLEVGNVAVKYMLGSGMASLFGSAISLVLISSISAMVWVGPRVTATMAEECRLWHFFRHDQNEIPVRALWLQFLISSVLLISGTFEQIMVYCGILLSFSSMLVVAGTFVLRYREKDKELEGYRSPLFPFFQIFYIAVSVWMISFAFMNNPEESLLGLINVVVGLMTYWLDRKMTHSLKNIKDSK